AGPGAARGRTGCSADPAATAAAAPPFSTVRRDVESCDAASDTRSSTSSSRSTGYATRRRYPVDDAYEHERAAVIGNSARYSTPRTDMQEIPSADRAFTIPFVFDP